jgi:hypothetical protein
VDTLNTFQYGAATNSKAGQAVRRGVAEGWRMWCG